MKRLGCWGIVALMLMLGGCTTKSQDTFQVLFTKQPVLSADTVYDRGTVIGRIVATDRAADNTTRITVDIAADYRHLMTDQTVFLVDAGRLVRESFKTVGRQLDPGSAFLGFRSGSELLWFRTRTLLTSSAARANREAVSLAGRFGQP